MGTGRRTNAGLGGPGFAAITGPIDFGEFYSGDARRHPTMRGRNISSTRGPVTAAGIPSYSPQGTGDRPRELLEHQPPLMEAA